MGAASPDDQHEVLPPRTVCTGLDSAAASGASRYYCDVPGASAKKHEKKSTDGHPAAKPKSVTMTDVADFVPTDAAVHGEPDGWALVGRPANLMVSAPPSTVRARLLGHDARVRFTPVAFRWDYGDGHAAVTDRPGESWEDLGQAELSTTPTSHIFTERGTFSGSVTVAYGAEYRYGDGAWHRIPGAVTGSRIPFQTLVVEERTVLVGDP